MFAVFRFFTGLFGGGSNMVLYVLMQEQIGSDWWAVSGKPYVVFCYAIINSKVFIPLFEKLISGTELENRRD